MDIDWCTVCNKHTTGGLYCSEECRKHDSLSPMLSECRNYSSIGYLDSNIPPLLRVNSHGRSISENVIQKDLTFPYSLTKRSSSSSSPKSAILSNSSWKTVSNSQTLSPLQHCGQFKWKSSHSRAAQA